MSNDAANAGGLPDFSEFLADYFIESEEHLSIARKCVLELEACVDQADIDPDLLDELFRSFHSLKGLSAMVEFRDAEQLAHHLENYLGALRRKQVAIEQSGLEALIAGVTALERAIAAQRDRSDPPRVTSLIEQLSDLVPKSGRDARPPMTANNANSEKASATTRKHARVLSKLKNGGHAWQVTFEPSADLIAAGIDVNSVRAKLKGLGDLIHSEPTIGPGGQVTFSFIIISQLPAASLLALNGDGMIVESYEIASTENTDAAVVASIRTTTGRSSHIAPTSLVRVDLKRLDELMRMVGELVLSRARLDDGLNRIPSIAGAAAIRSLKETNLAIERQLRDLREGVMRVRMVPVREVFARMQFVVRDLARETGKKAELHLQGEETQIDKFIVERIMDPLLHLVRNAISHGLEPIAERIAAQKPAAGQINLRARTTGDTVLIEVEDDGYGIDERSVFAQAKARGLTTADASSDLASLLDILCTAGFSTRTEIDRASGRGVGMDVVRRVVEELGGVLSMRSTIGRGTCFIIQLPLTLAIIDALVVAVGKERYAVPQTAVREVINVEADTITGLENNELIPHHQGVLPLVRLAQLFDVSAINSSSPYALIIGEGERAIALAVDRVLSLREVVVRPLTDKISQVAGIAGATELGDGQVVLILDTANLIRSPRVPRIAAATN